MPPVRSRTQQSRNPTLSRNSQPSVEPSILSVGQNTSILAFRESALRTAGCLVRSATPVEAQELLGLHSFQIGIFCHTLSHEQAVRLACAAHQHSPATKLLLLVNERARGFEGMLFDDSVEAIAGPEALLVRLKRLMDEDSEAAGSKPGGKSQIKNPGP